MASLSPAPAHVSGRSRSSRCPICFSAPTAPFATPCNHTFCYECITTHLCTRSSCPVCGARVTASTLAPNPVAEHLGAAVYIQTPQCTPELVSGTVAPPPLPRRPVPVAAPSPLSRAVKRARVEARVQAAMAAETGSPQVSMSHAGADIGAAGSSGGATVARSGSASDSVATSRGATASNEFDSSSGVSSSSVGSMSIRRTDLAASHRKSSAAGVQQSARNSSAGHHYISRQQQFHHVVNPAMHCTPDFSGTRGLVGYTTPVVGALNSSYGFRKDPLAEVDEMSAEQLQQVISSLSQKLHQKESSQKKSTSMLLLDFLRRARSEKQSAVELLNSHISRLNADISETEARIGAHDLSPRKERDEIADGSICAHKASTAAVHSTAEDGKELASFRAKRQRLGTHFDSLQSRYFNQLFKDDVLTGRNCLNRLAEDIAKVTQFSQFRCRATLMHTARFPEAPGSDVFRTSNIVSSIEFDRESEFLATAGVSKRIKIFEFSNILRNLADVHYPIKEIQASAKLSWAVWNPYIRSHLASSDYEGVVTLWDAHRGLPLREYEEHEKRAWSVDFCIPNPTVFASGSDDGKVKLWVANSPDSVMTIENHANVCSVKFNPVEGEKLAFGSAHHHVHYYDLRNIRQPLQVFESHKKTVSYVKFMSGTELVSACADSSIKLWNLKTMQLERTFTGHSNDRHFVGLSVNSDYIACGSEENAVFGYYKGIPEPAVRYRFAGLDPLTGEETQDDDEMLFVSSVCWCPRHPSLLVGANSLGVIRVLDLVDGCDVNE